MYSFFKMSPQLFNRGKLLAVDHILVQVVTNLDDFAYSLYCNFILVRQTTGVPATVKIK